MDRPHEAEPPLDLPAWQDAPSGAADRDSDATAAAVSGQGYPRGDEGAAAENTRPESSRTENDDPTTDSALGAPATASQVETPSKPEVQPPAEKPVDPTTTPSTAADTRGQDRRVEQGDSSPRHDDASNGEVDRASAERVETDEQAPQGPHDPSNEVPQTATATPKDDSTSNTEKPEGDEPQGHTDVATTRETQAPDTLNEGRRNFPKPDSQEVANVDGIGAEASSLVAQSYPHASRDRTSIDSDEATQTDEPAAIVRTGTRDTQNDKSRPKEGPAGEERQPALRSDARNLPPVPNTTESQDAPGQLGVARVGNPDSASPRNHDTPPHEPRQPKPNRKSSTPTHLPAIFMDGALRNAARDPHMRMPDNITMDFENRRTVRTALAVVAANHPTAKADLARIPEVKAALNDRQLGIRALSVAPNTASTWLVAGWQLSKGSSLSLKKIDGAYTLMMNVRRALDYDKIDSRGIHATMLPALAYATAFRHAIGNFNRISLGSANRTSDRFEADMRIAVSALAGLHNTKRSSVPPSGYPDEVGELVEKVDGAYKAAHDINRKPQAFVGLKAEERIARQQANLARELEKVVKSYTRESEAASADLKAYTRFLRKNPEGIVDTYARHANLIARRPAAEEELKRDNHTTEWQEWRMKMYAAMLEYDGIIPRANETLKGNHQAVRDYAINYAYSQIDTIKIGGIKPATAIIINRIDPQKVATEPRPRRNVQDREELARKARELLNALTDAALEEFGAQCNRESLSPLQQKVVREAHVHKLLMQADLADTELYGSMVNPTIASNLDQLRLRRSGRLASIAGRLGDEAAQLPTGVLKEISSARGLINHTNKPSFRERLSQVGQGIKAIVDEIAPGDKTVT